MAFPVDLLQSFRPKLLLLLAGILLCLYFLTSGNSGSRLLLDSKMMRRQKLPENVPAYEGIQKRAASHVILPKYSVSYCPIPKNMLQVGLGIFCYLRNATLFAERNLTIATDSWKFRSCKGKNEFDHYRLDLLRNDSWQHLAIVRDPIDRLISGWLNKCLGRAKFCYGCGQNLSCFIVRNHLRMLQLSQTSPAKTVLVEDHFVPQNWYCNFTHHLRRYEIIKYRRSEQFYEDLLNFFESASVKQEILVELRRQISLFNTAHSTFGMVERQRAEDTVFGSQFLLKMIVRTYRHDYDIFDFELPNGL